MALVYPVLQVCDRAVVAFGDEASLRRAVSLATDAAIEAGYFEQARLVGADLVEHRIARLELAGRSSLAGWAKRGREIRVLETTRVGEVGLAELKAIVSAAIETSCDGEAQQGAEGLLAEVEAADSYAGLAALFGS